MTQDEIQEAVWIISAQYNADPYEVGAFIGAEMARYMNAGWPCDLFHLKNGWLSR